MSQSKTPETADTSNDAVQRAEDAFAALDAAGAAKAAAVETVDEVTRAADDGNPLADAGAAETALTDSNTQLSDADRAAEAAVDEILTAPRPAEAPAAAAAMADEPAEDEPEAPAQKRSLASMVLAVLAILVAGGALAIWGGPKLAPHLPPAFAAYLVPQAPEADARIAALEAALAEAKTAQEATDSVVTTLGTALGELKQQVASGGNLAAKLAKLEGDVAALAARPAGSGGADPAALAALEARIAALTPPDASALAALEARIAELSGTVASTAATASTAEAARVAAESQVTTAIKDAAIKTAVAALTAQLATGVPFETSLAKLGELTGAPVPEALAAHAGGVPTLANLNSQFPLAAQAALAADVASTNDGTTLGAATTWLFSQVTPRPTAETSGDGVGAILSRVSARLAEQALPEALREAETLPEHSKVGLGAWLNHLQARVAAEQALAAWSIDLGLNG